MFKLDDDNFVRLDLFWRELVSHGPDFSTLYWGRLKQHVPVIHDSTRKWYDPLYPNNEYEPYMLGSGYVLGRELMRAIAERASDLPLYANEDASVGMWIKV